MDLDLRYKLFIFYCDGMYSTEYFYSWNTCKKIKRVMIEDSDVTSFRIIPLRLM